MKKAMIITAISVAVSAVCGIVAWLARVKTTETSKSV